MPARWPVGTPQGSDPCHVPFGVLAALDASVRDCPGVALLDALAVLAEAEQRRAGERHVAAVLADVGTPLDGRAIAVHERLAEPRVRPLLLRERPLTYSRRICGSRNGCERKRQPSA